MQLAGLYLPNRIARYFFVAMDDVMGQAAFKTLLKQAELFNYINELPPDNMAKQFDFASMTALNIALEDSYGIRGGRGMTLRVGRASFSLGLRNFGAMAGMSDPAFRALPRDECCFIGLKALANIYNTFSDQHCEVEQTTDSFRFIVDNSATAWGRKSEKPVCHALAGIVQECMRWSSNGHEYYVFETACTACGDPRCIFVINKAPIG
ncbi:MAG: 4-vinyl reductase [Anaerolineaceae bacterium]|nr:4-vinyl reductase [Anaerolineaceae bacterium]